MEFVRGRLLVVVLFWDCHWDFCVVQSSAHKTFLLRDVDWGTVFGGTDNTKQHIVLKKTQATLLIDLPSISERVCFPVSSAGGRSCLGELGGSRTAPGTMSQFPHPSS